MAAPGPERPLSALDGRGEVEHEAVVLGGGPAGAAAATLLARRAHTVALVRPRAPPAPFLAESVPPSAAKLLDELGFTEAIRAARFEPNRGNTVRWGGAPLRSEEFDRFGAHADRASLERVLSEAVSSSGVRVLDGFARSARRTGGEWTVACEDPDGEGGGRRFELRAPWVIDATGRRGLLARAWREPERSPATLALVGRCRRPGGWPERLAPRGHTLVESHREGWSWSVPLSAEVRCVTAMVDASRGSLTDRSLSLEAELGKAGHIGRLLEGAGWVGEPRACSASLHTSSRFADDGLLLAGDAASFIDPLSSFGVKKALASGWTAAVAAHTALTDPARTRIALDFHESQERELYASCRRLSVPFFEAAVEGHGGRFWEERLEAARKAGGDGRASPVEASRSSGELGRGTGKAVRCTRKLGRGAGEAARNSEGTSRSAGEDAGTPPEEAGAMPDGPGTMPGEAGASSVVPRPRVEAAFQALRARASVNAAPGRFLGTVVRPAVHGYQVVEETQLTSPLVPGGLRHACNVDLRVLVELAPDHDEVPELWAAYNARATPVPLPDFLTALCTAFAAGLLEVAE